MNNSPPPSQNNLRQSLAVAQGKLSNTRFCASPNFNQRPAHTRISLLVIHNISLPPEQFGGPYIEQFFCNQLNTSEHPYFETIKGLEVSAHCLIKRDGEIIQFVNFEQRAWHAGRSSFGGELECNDFSVGIELEGTDETPYTQAQYEQLVTVTKALQQAYPAITQDRITGHSDIAPGRKTDPGPAFDWHHYKNKL